MSKIKRFLSAFKLIMGVIILVLVFVYYLLASAEGRLITSEDSMFYTLGAIFGFGFVVWGFYDIMKK